MNLSPAEKFRETRHRRDVALELRYKSLMATGPFLQPCQPKLSFSATTIPQRQDVFSDILPLRSSQEA